MYFCDSFYIFISVCMQVCMHVQHFDQLCYFKCALFIVLFIYVLLHLGLGLDNPANSSGAPLRAIIPPL